MEKIATAFYMKIQTCKILMMEDLNSHGINEIKKFGLRGFQVSMKEEKQNRLRIVVTSDQ